jgi:hypothetical protein
MLKPGRAHRRELRVSASVEYGQNRETRPDQNQCDVKACQHLQRRGANRLGGRAARAEADGAFHCKKQLRASEAQLLCASLRGDYSLESY